MKKTLTGMCVLFSLMLLASCSHHLKEIRLVPQITEHRLLIAGDSSEFKDSVRDKIIETYKSNTEITVINIKDLPKVDAAPYDAVLIMDTCMAWSGFNPSLKSFLDKDENRAKTVLSMTAADPGWKYSFKDVDAITSASRVENMEAFYSRINDGLQKIMK